LNGLNVGRTFNLGIRLNQIKVIWEDLPKSTFSRISENLL